MDWQRFAVLRRVGVAEVPRGVKSENAARKRDLMAAGNVPSLKLVIN